MSKARIILHVDMNCYYVSCEIANKKEYQNKPVAVAPRGASRKGIILTASYNARKYGVNSAMRVSEALEKCPHLIILEPHYELYEAFSRKFVEYFFKITPLVEVASIDEAYLDVTDVCPPDKVIDLAHQIQSYIYNVLKLPCSIGIGPNKFLAKMGSDYKKPMGITVFRKREIKEMLWPLPVQDMIGVGKKTLENLRFLKIKTIGDLANYQDHSILEAILGKNTTAYLLDHAYGNGDTVVDVNRSSEFSSMSNSQTFEMDLFEPKIILDNLKALTNTVAFRLVEHKYNCQTVSIQIRYNDFRTIVRSKTLINPTNDNLEIFAVVKDLFEDYYDERIPVRLLGVGASKLTETKQDVKQMSIFDDLSKEEKELNINNLLSQINTSFGDGSIQIGVKNSKNIDKLNRDYKKQKKENFD